VWNYLRGNTDHQKLENDKQNVDLSSPEKNYADAHEWSCLLAFVLSLLSCCHSLRAWVRLNRLRTCLCKWGMASSAACEYGAEQTVDHVVLHCPIHRLPPRTTRPDVSGRWDNRMAAQYLPRYLGGLAVDERTRSN